MVPSALNFWHHQDSGNLFVESWSSLPSLLSILFIVQIAHLMAQVAAELAQMVSSLPCLKTLELTFASAGILDTLRASPVVQVGLESTSGLSSRALHDLHSLHVDNLLPCRISAWTSCRCLDNVQITVELICGFKQMHFALQTGAIQTSLTTRSGTAQSFRSLATERLRFEQP